MKITVACSAIGFCGFNTAISTGIRLIDKAADVR